MRWLWRDACLACGHLPALVMDEGPGAPGQVGCVEEEYG